MTVLFRSSYVVLLVLTFTVCHLPAQQLNQPQGILQSITTQIEDHLLNHPTEKVYIHFDRTFYFLDEYCFFKAYVVDGVTLLPTTISGVLYLDWVDSNQQVVHHQTLKIKDGTAIGDCHFDSTFSGGQYQIAAYTQWMRNAPEYYFYSKSVSLINPHTEILQADPTVDTIHGVDLQFFAEGGVLLAGCINNIAFKAIDIAGKGISVTGKVFNHHDEELLSFSSLHNGMGKFDFVPQDTELYHVVLSTGEIFNMPRSIISGYTLSVNKMNEESIQVQVGASSDLVPTTVYIVGQIRGELCYSSQVTITKRTTQFNIPLKSFPSGILQLTLFDIYGQPLNERRVFVRSTDTFNISVFCPDEDFLPKDSVLIRITVKNHVNQPVSLKLSVAITDASFASKDICGPNIYTQLLLQSELKGYIEQPSWYFELEDLTRSQALDLVMLTHGWTRYHWDAGDKKNVLLFYAEKGIKLCGRIVQKGNQRQIPLAQITLLKMEPSNEEFFVIEADSTGFFQIDDIDFTDSTAWNWQVTNAKGKVLDAEILIDNHFNQPPINVRHLFKSENDTKDVVWTKNITKKFIENSLDTIASMINLSEVVIKSKSIPQIKEIGLNRIIIKPDAKELTLKNSARFIAKHALGITSAQPVQMDDGFVLWYTPGGGSISTIIDGTKIEFTSTTQSPYAIINMIPIDEIEYAVVQGSNREGYNIYIKTNPEAGRKRSKLSKLYAEGYDAVHEFYHPKYGPKDVYEDIPDHRITLYWNPELTTDARGNIEIKFYNSDSARQLLLIAEGIHDESPIVISTFIGKN